MTHPADRALVEASTSLTDAELDELLAKAKAATPGPWNVLAYPQGDTVISVIAGEANYRGGHTQATWIADLDAENLDGPPGENEANAAHIAAANPETILRPIDMVERLRRYAVHTPLCAKRGCEDCYDCDCGLDEALAATAAQAADATGDK